GHRQASSSLGRTRNAEVRYHCPTCVALDENVVRLHVTVNYPARMCVIQCVCHIPQHLPHELRRRTRLAMQARGQAFALHETHRKPHQAIALINAVDGDDVRMAQLSRRLSLTKESLANLRPERQLGRQYLERHMTPKPHIARTIHYRHSAAAYLLQQLVALTSRGPYLLAQSL